uniref:UBA and UBX domain-containing protein n=2 Tax=Chenopodium quinoa TaxID=63459 RepID=A0A803M7Y8_CHEQI
AGARSQYSLRSRRTADNNDGNNARSSDSRTRRRVGGVRTFADLNRNSGADGSDSDSDGDRPAQFFTGGQKSGMVVQDPSKDINAEAIFEQARRVGSIEAPVDVQQPSSSSRSFTGTARLLSGETVSSSPPEQAPETITHTITLWRNGFTVDDGPLRRFDDVENAPFLQSITNSECPKELEPADRKTAVHCNLVRRNENCPEPQKRKVPFQGVGRTLGASHSTPSDSASVTARSSAPPPVMGLVVDDKLPSTSIQLRLADGTRMVSRFNYHHTIRDIHAFIDASRPARTGVYTLQMMGFPPRQLTDLEQTIEQAGLANSVVIQKF